MTNEIYLGRQSILDAERRLHGFELLFRSEMTGGARIADDLAATTSVIVRALSDFGIHAVLNDFQGFINCGASFLMSEQIELLPPQKVVIEILETTVATEEIRRRCAALKTKGYRLALDDFRGISGQSGSLLPLVDIIKVDILGMEQEQICKVTRDVAGLGATLLAEKVESEQQFLYCRGLGYRLFQGYHFSRPEVMRGKRLSPAHLSLIKILALLQSDSELQELDQVFKQDPMLGVRLLRLTNSAACGLRTPLKSIAHAILVLGRRQLQRWVLLLMLAETGDANGRSLHLHSAAARAKFMEILATIRGDASPDSAFITGVVSVMDVLLGIPMHKVVISLGLSAEVSRALTHREGAIGNLLRIAEVIEGKDDYSNDGFLKERAGTNAEMLNRVQGQALAWASTILCAV